MTDKLVEKIARIIANEHPNQIKYTLSSKELAHKLIPIISQAVAGEIIGWGIEICHEHLPKWQGEVDLMGGVLSRRECPECWKALRAKYTGEVKP